MGKALNSSVGRALLATIEERNTQIRELEREVEAQAVELQRKEDIIAGAAKDVETVSARSVDYYGYWQEELAKNKQLAGIMATMDITAIEKIKAQHREEMDRKLITISGLREDLYRCLGWIAAKHDQHPVPSRPEPGRVERPMTAEEERRIFSSKTKDWVRR